MFAADATACPGDLTRWAPPCSVRIISTLGKNLACSDHASYPHARTASTRANRCGSGSGTAGKHHDRHCAGPRGRRVAAEETTVVDQVDPARGTEQRAARISAPTAGAYKMDEPQRSVGLHRQARKAGRTAGRGRVSRADSGPIRNGVRTVR